MSEPVRRRVKLVNPHGLHMRPSTVLINLANRFESTIRISKGARTVDGKSIMELLTLAAPAGTELTVTAEGRDAGEAVAAIAELIESGFGDYA